MSTVLYLANQQIQAVTGTSGAKKIAVQKAYSADVPEGIIINGIIMDGEGFVEFIKEFWQTNKLPTKDVTLVINSSKFVGKTIEMPKLRDSKTLEFIDREFADIKKEDEVIYGYIPLTGGDGNLNRLYAESISTEFIKEYIEIFQAAGISVKTICSGESSLISLANMTLATWYKTFVLLIADNITLTTVLWVDGSFYYFNSVRCFHEQGTEEYAMDVARSVSQIIQFMQAHQIEHVLESIRIAGIPDVDTRIYQLALNGQGINVDIEPFDSSTLSANKADVQSYIHAASGLVTNGKFQNFLNQYNSRRRKKSQSGETNKSLIIVAAVFAVMLVATIASYVYKVIKQKEFDRLDEEVNSPIVLEQIAEYDMYLERNSFLVSQYNAIADIDENIMSYPICDSDVIKIIDDCSADFADIQFDSFNSDSGLVNITAKSENAEDINKFIKELNKQEIFNKVDYTGYSFNSQTGLWDIHLVCTLTEAAGR